MIFDKINRARQNNSSSLDLSGLGLEEVPLEVFKLTGLKSLKLGRYRTPKKNRIKVISGEIKNLINLEVLDLTDNEISELPPEISELVNLKKIVLSSNKFTVLPPGITTLENLEELFIGNNRIKFLPIEVKGLVNLKSLRLNGNKFNSIPSEINLFSKLEYLYLYDNPIKNVPKELLGLNGKDNVCSIIKQWFLDKSEGESYIYEAKLILVGEAEAGKTSLSKKLRNPNSKLNLTQPMTKGIEVKKWEFDYNEKKIFSTNIWDFGGQDIMHATHRYFLTERSLYVLVVDVRAEKTDFYYWLNIIELFSAKSPVIIVLNEKHSYRKDIPNAIIDRFESSIVGVYNVDLKTNSGLDRLTKAIKKNLKSLPHIGKEKMLNKWLSIRNALEKRTDDFISYEEYEKITSRFGVNETVQSLRISKILHELGVVLHFQFDSILRNTVILNKSWATEAVYLVLLDKRITDNLGKVTSQDLDRIWSKYSFSNRNDLIQLMINFLLCYVVEANKTYIIPQLLPENLLNKDYQKYFKEGNIYYRYCYLKFMPKGIISQLIVRMHKYIFDDIQWKTGVVFRIENSYVEIIEDYFDRKIKIRVSGSNKRNALTIVRKEICEINENFEKLEVTEELPCGCIMEEDKPFFIERGVLEKFKVNDEKMIKCHVCMKELPVLQLLDSVLGDEKYIDLLLEQVNTFIPDEKYVLGLMESENNEVEFKATFHVPVFSKDDKKFLEIEYSKNISAAKESGNEKMAEAMDKKKKEIEKKLTKKETENIVIHSVIKTLVAFANSNGGELVIGIDEDKDGKPYILGMENDISKAGDKDSFMNNKFDKSIERRIGNSFFALIERRDWITINGKEVWVLKVKPSTTEIFCNNGENGAEREEMFYIRREASTEKLEGRELVKYIKERF